MRSTVFSLVVAAVVLVVVFNLLRSRRLREKYAALWIIVGLLVVSLALFPGVLAWLARLVGFVVPSNLLFFLAIGLLMGVCLHLSLEISRLEDEGRVLAENIAILNLQLEEVLKPAEDLIAPLPDTRAIEEKFDGGEP
jgi:hypothetical protein